MKSHREEFPRVVMDAAWLRCGGRCEACGQELGGRTPIYDHIVPTTLGGPATLKNCQVLCPPCHRLKTSTEDMPRIAKAKRVEARRAGIKRSRNPMQGGRGSRLKKRVGRNAVLRYHQPLDNDT